MMEQVAKRDKDKYGGSRESADKESRERVEEMVRQGKAKKIQVKGNKITAKQGNYK